MLEFPDYAQIGNIAFIEELYLKFQNDPASVDSSWRHFFEGVDFAELLYKKKGGQGDFQELKIFQLVQAYRKFGHLLAKTNPLAKNENPPFELELKNLGFVEGDLGKDFPTLGFLKKERAPLKEVLAALQAIYADRIGFEYMDFGSFEMEKWVQSQIEPKLLIEFSPEEKKDILENLDKAEIYETFLNMKYPGQTRFSIEGNETLIPVLAEMISQGANLGIEMLILGIAHRGRLNVLTNILNKPYGVVFKEFEDTIPYPPGEMGDVKYHKGYSSEVSTKKGQSIRLLLSPNSSCLESTDPIVLGQTRAYQEKIGDKEQKKGAAILMHGDAALAGQGVVYEILQMAKAEGFSTGGTIHIAINNQIGYTTRPNEGRSTRYCTDIAKAFGAPVFHANAEDPESCVYAAKLAVQFKHKFGCDVFIDLNGYRKYGHNEGDEPGYTQPVEYKSIRGKKSIRELYFEKLSQEGLTQKGAKEAFESDFKQKLNKAFEEAKEEKPVDLEERFGKGASDFVQPSSQELFNPTDTKVEKGLLKEAMTQFAAVPQGFHLHPKLEKWLSERKQMVEGDQNEKKIDWGAGECLAFATLALQKVPVRLAGQDCLRGTFSQRHAGWFDQESGELYRPFSHLKEKEQANVDIYNTILSEYGSLGFEFGYSWAMGKGLVMWEAQYGDFIIGAEILIDHYLVSAEEKWRNTSSLVLLLPHGYEGAGPEHSSGRMERFLQLAANNNIQVANPTTPAQYFHLLRRQALRKIRKPLIVFTPKSLLRHPECKSSLSEFTEGQFEEFLDDLESSKEAEKLIFCSGKVYYDLYKVKKEMPNGALIRVEQLYPLHIEKIKALFQKYKKVTACLWVQEEPENMGAGSYIVLELQKQIPHIPIRFIARPRSGSTATGSKKRHTIEQQAIIDEVKK